MQTRSKRKYRQTQAESDQDRPPKRCKLPDPDAVWVPPPAFWDNLSTIELERSAIRELNRRFEAASDEPPVHIPSTPNFRANDIKGFARQGGPDLSDLRGVRGPNIDLSKLMPQYSTVRTRQKSTMAPSKRKPLTGTSRGRSTTGVSKSRSTTPASKSRSTTPASKNKETSTTKTASSSPYNQAFAQHLTDHGIYPLYGMRDGKMLEEPKNMEEIRERARQPRQLLPSEFPPNNFVNFLLEISSARTEQQINSILDKIEGPIDDYRCRSGNVLFTNLLPLTDGTLTAPKPDTYHGSRPEDLNLKIRNELQGLIVPSKHTDLPMLPNFFAVAKGPYGTQGVAETQARYDGAIGARATHALQTWGQAEKAFDGNAYTIVSIFTADILKMYTTHPVNNSGRVEYVITVIGSWLVANNHADLVKAIAAYRNLRDWAKECRDTLIEAANSSANLSTDPSVESLLTYTTPPTENDQPSVSDDELYVG